MVDKLEAGKTYRLVDSEGYLEGDENNVGLIGSFFTNGEVTIESVRGVSGSGYIGNYNIISRDEREFFEEVVDTPDKQPTKRNWDGEEPLEVGMYVKCADCSYEVTSITRDRQFLLESDVNHPMVVPREHCTSLTPSKRDSFLQGVLEKHKRHSLDNAHDTLDTVSSLEYAWSTAYDYLVEGGLLK